MVTCDWLLGTCGWLQSIMDPRYWLLATCRLLIVDGNLATLPRLPQGVSGFPRSWLLACGIGYESRVGLCADHYFETNPDKGGRSLRRAQTSKARLTRISLRLLTCVCQKQGTISQGSHYEYKGSNIQTRVSRNQRIEYRTSRIADLMATRCSIPAIAFLCYSRPL